MGCRRVRTKRELVRIVRAPDGRALVDPVGSAPGRGAYICPEPDCVASGRRRLAGAFRAGTVDFTALEFERLDV